MKKFLISFSVLTLFIPAIVSADFFLRQARDLLYRYGQFLTEEGYTLASVDVEKIYTVDGRQKYEIQVQTGYEYTAIAVCDTDCKDIDLKLWGLDGKLITEDVEYDDYPMVEFDVTRSGKLLLEVIIPDCRANRCSYGVGLFRQAKSSTPRPMPAPIDYNSTSAILLNNSHGDLVMSVREEIKALLWMNGWVPTPILESKWFALDSEHRRWGRP